MDEWFSALEYYFRAWLGADDAPHEFDRAIRHSFGRDVSFELVYPVGELGGGRGTFVLMNGTNTTLAAFQPPGKTVFTVLGSIVGGVYAETVEVTSNTMDVVEATYAHRKLREPLVVRLISPTPDAGDLNQWFHQQGQKRAWDDFHRLRDILRNWASATTK